jgi:hypothetical protein
MMTTMSRRTARQAARKTIARVRRGAQNAAQRIRRLVTAASTAVLLVMINCRFALAQSGGGSDGGAGAFGAKIVAVTAQFTSVGRPLLGLALTVGIITALFEPALPDLARENKGAIRRGVFFGIILGIVPDLVSFVFG